MLSWPMQLDFNKEAQLQLMPQERVQNVKPCWETVPDEERVELLSVDLSELRIRADDLAEKAKKQAGQSCSSALANPFDTGYCCQLQQSMTSPELLVCSG